MSPSVVGVLHPGQMGAAIGAQATANGLTVQWCPDGRGDAAGATVIDGSVFGPPPGDGLAARLYLAGPGADTRLITDLLATTRLEPIHLDEKPGRASALKMAFSSYQKASRALAAVAHALADDHDVTDALLSEARTMPSDILADRGFLTTVAARAWRWAPEMHEVADTLRAQHLPPDLALAAAALLQRWNDNIPALTRDHAAVLGRLHEATR